MPKTLENTVNNLCQKIKKLSKNTFEHANMNVFISTPSDDFLNVPNGDSLLKGNGTTFVPVINSAEKITFSNGDITIPATGTYQITYFASFTKEDGPNYVNFQILVDGTPTLPQSRITHDNADQGIITFNFITKLSKNNVIRFVANYGQVGNLELFQWNGGPGGVISSLSINRIL